jgi:ribosomal protein S18 acetylase RimI-like enzyme
MIDYATPVRADGPELSAMASQSFTETFGTLYRPEDLAHFIDQAFGPNGLPAQLDLPDFAVHVARDDGRIVGFAKLGPVAFPGEWGPGDVELYQLYVLASHHGTGVGAALMDWVIAEARRRGFTRLVLSVFVDNLRAQRFYARYGMREIGRYEFRVGNQIDDDRIWALDL